MSAFSAAICHIINISLADGEKSADSGPGGGVYAAVSICFQKRAGI